VNDTLRERPAAMVRRVSLEVGALLGEDAAATVAAAVAAALTPRDVAIEYDHDSRILHPGRTVLILISDAGLRDADALAAAAFIESIDVELAATDGLDNAASDGALALLEAVPRVPSERMLEELVVADPRLALVLIAERLDHARHLHLRDDLDWRAFHGDVLDVWLPASRRFSPGLARRFDRWEETFRRRLFGR
jgi:hypothetical protein